MGMLLYKAGVTLQPNPAGARLHSAIERVARDWPGTLTITAGSDSHGTDDPHTKGEAFDVRTHGLTDEQKQLLVRAVLVDASDNPRTALTPMTIAGVWFALATPQWFGQIEHHNEPSEHAHFQLRNGHTFTA